MHLPTVPRACALQHACRARRRAVSAAAEPRRPARYFDEDLDPSSGVRELWGQGKARDLIREARRCSLETAPSDSWLQPAEGELLWTVDWQTQLDGEVKALQAEAERGKRGATAAPPPPPQQGFLSLSRSLALDDPRVELESPRLRSAAGAASALAEGLAPLSAALRPAGGPAYAPTRGERRGWTRTAKFTRSSTLSEVREARRGEAEQEAARAADLRRYQRLKAELLAFTAASGGLVCAALLALYDRETAGSYALGAAGGLLYLRLLQRSVDGASGQGAPSLAGAVEGVAGGQRLLIPALLVAGWNRWNALGAPTAGFELHVLPILAGFFTYKASTVWQLAREVFPLQLGAREEAQ